MLQEMPAHPLARSQETQKKLKLCSPETHVCLRIVCGNPRLLLEYTHKKLKKLMRFFPDNLGAC